MKIYLAARYLRRDELREYRKQLHALGHEVTSRWLNERKSAAATVAEVTEAEHIFIARRDLEDIEVADMFVVFAGEPRGQKRGGHHVELGYALAKGKQCIALEERENTFYYLPELKFFTDFEEFMEDLNGN